MTFYHGLGMFFLGMGAIIFGAIVAYFIINKVSMLIFIRINFKE